LPGVYHESRRRPAFGALVNAFRSTPFIFLLTAWLPLVRRLTQRA
jgi:ABC-type methionine transport system permease subunit